jgi:hypothetical protein
MSLPLVFDYYNSIIEVPSPDITLDMQYLINQIRDQEEELDRGINYAKIADASGKDSLGGGVYTAITVTLLDQWRVRFEAKSGPDTIQCTISGGNLVGGPGGNPIAPSAYTQVVNLSSASGTISIPSTSSENTNLKYLLASLTGAQKIIGDIYYWDPVSGNDGNTGLTPDAAVATFAQAHTLVTAAHHDVIFCLASDPSGITTVTETISITKSTTKLKGPGYTFQLIPTTSTASTIAISASNVEVSGLYISTDDAGGQNAITLAGNYCIIKDCWITAARGHGISITSAINPIITNCVIENSGGSGTGNGINLGNTTTRAEITKCIIYENVNGIALSGTGISDNTIYDSLVYKNSAYGLNIGSGVVNTTARGGNTLVNNTSGSSLDSGTDTYIETPAGGASASEIADAVWDEVLTGHVTTSSASKILKDAKVKATLASLK